jgi:hypothetical protein
MKKYLLLILMLSGCSDNKSTKSLDKPKTVNELLFENAKKEDNNMSIFLGFNYGMSNNEYERTKQNLLSQKKLYINYKGNIGYDLYLKVNKCEATFVPLFDSNKLNGISMNYIPPYGVDDIEEQTLEFLKSAYGEPTIIAPLIESDSSQVSNETVYHWIKGRKHLLYINSSTLSRHIIEFKNAFDEVKESKFENNISKQLEENKKSKGITSKGDFK